MTQMTSPMAIAAIADRTRSPKTAGALAIRMPLEGAVYLIDPTLRPDFQTLPLRSRGATGRAEWFMDDAPVGVSLGDSPVAWPLARGAHTIQVRDADGRSASTRIIVK